MNENSIWLSWVSAFLNLMKYFYVGSSPSKCSVIVVCKISLNSCLKGLHQLFTDRASRSSREKDLKIYFRRLHQRISRGLGKTIQTSESMVPSSILVRTFFSPLLFLYFFFLLVQFSFWLLQFFCFFIWLKIFRFINFRLYCLMLPVPPKSFARSCGLRISSIVYNISH